MRCPTLAELPPPPQGKTGWPWTEESPQLPDTMPDGRPWPRITIVTPNYNYGQFLEETIRSVLLQGYPDLEYIIIDGGSTDNSVEIIKKYEPWLAYWVSEPDRGQSHAINKGLARASGDILAYLNSDDVYISCVFEKVAILLETNKNKWCCGGWEIIDAKGERIKTDRPSCPSELYKWLGAPIWGEFRFGQPSVFWRRELIEKIGYFREDFHFAFDREFMIRAKVAGFDPLVVEEIFSQMRIHEETKSRRQFRKFIKEYYKIALQYQQWIKESRLRQSILKRLRVMSARAQIDEVAGLRTEGRIERLRQLVQAVCSCPITIMHKLTWKTFIRIVLGI